MAVYAVVPVKNLKVSKRRLSAVVTPQERKQLTLAMLEDVLDALRTSTVDKAVVVGENSEVQATAERFDVSYVSASRLGLNLAIEEATSWCIQRGATSVLVVPADIPLVTSKDVNCLLQLGAERRAIVLSPSQNLGTNAILQNPPKLIPACFGPKSFVKHAREARLNGLMVRFYCSAGLITDVDSAKDLTRLLSIRNFTRSRRFLEQIGFLGPIEATYLMENGNQGYRK